MIKAVIFDLGGVLVRTHDYAGRRKWEERFALGEREADALVFDSETSRRAELGQIADDEVWAGVAQRLGLDAPGLAEFQRDFWSGDVLDLELLAFMQQLRPRYKLAVLSNAWNTLRPLFATRFAPLGELVDAIVISAEEGLRKPDAELYRRALARLDVAPDEAVFVDDMPQNVAGARAAGLHAIQFVGTAQTLAELRALGVEAAGDGQAAEKAEEADAADDLPRP